MKRTNLVLLSAALGIFAFATHDLNAAGKSHSRPQHAGNHSHGHAKHGHARHGHAHHGHAHHGHARHANPHHGHGHHGRPGHHHGHPGHRHPPVVRYTPPVVRYTPPVVVRVPSPPVVVPAGPTVITGTGGGPLTRSAWVGYNSLTKTYSVAFDSPGVSGPGILIRAGYDSMVLGPTDWTSAVSYQKSVGAPGW
jgi:hypothetical protein